MWPEILAIEEVGRNTQLDLVFSPNLQFLCALAAYCMLYNRAKPQTA